MCKILQKFAINMKVHTNQLLNMNVQKCTKILIGFVREFLRGFLELSFLKVFENCFILYNLSIKALVCQ